MGAAVGLHTGQEEPRLGMGRFAGAVRVPIRRSARGERVDDITDGLRGRCGHDDQRTPVPHAVVTAPVYQPEQILALNDGQPAFLDRVETSQTSGVDPVSPPIR